MEDGKANARQETEAISDYYVNILSSPQSFAVKAPRVADTYLSLRAYKRARDWFRRWYFHHLNSSKTLPPPHNKTTQSSQDS